MPFEGGQVYIHTEGYRACVTAGTRSYRVHSRQDFDRFLFGWRKHFYSRCHCPTDHEALVRDYYGTSIRRCTDVVRVSGELAYPY
jgi:hypothetical protein